MPDASEIKHGTMQFKKNKYIYEEEEYTIEGEWLNGVPHGVCIIETEKRRGVYTFTHGESNGGPAWWEMKQDGTRVSFEYDDNGEPKGIYRWYYSDS